ncbi:MAG: metallophosphoesterase [Galactobacter sp.]|uniref:metallophosphoesterase n=1 Tax=Galactobacter sp. TaxID=2676125 RepID=UPI0025C2E2FE|nr:metallophosphoesterase [Galactobacter sp.]
MVTETDRVHRPAVAGLSRIGSGLGAVAAAGVGALALANAQTRNFRLREEHLPILPPGQQPRRVLHLSDIHMVPGQDAKTAWLHSLADLEPDLVVNTGDNLSHRHAVDALLNALQPLMRFPGVFVPGSNCYFAPRPKSPLRYFRKVKPGDDPRGPRDELDWRRMHQAFALAGWHDASNRSLSMPLGGMRLDVTGVDDPHLGLDEFQGWPRGSSTSADSPHLRLALAHAPYRQVLDTFARAQPDLVLAGHTHGGQVCSPGYGALVSNCDLPTGLAAGLNWWQVDGHRVPVNISAGLGASRLAPYRLACPPEAILLTLTSR